MRQDHHPAEAVDCIPGSLDDWYLITEDLARVWLRVSTDEESMRLEDLIARTKMPYVNWNDLLKDPHFNSILRKVAQEQAAGSPKGVFAAHINAFSRGLTKTGEKPKPQVAPTLEAPLTSPAKINYKTRLAVTFILGALAGSGLLKATQSTPPHTTITLPNR